MWDSNKENIFNAFLLLYLNVLSNDKELIERFNDVVFHLDEANSDKEAKKVVKDYMSLYPRLLTDRPFNLKIETDSGVIPFTYAQLSQVRIKRVYLPEEITRDMKDAIKASKNNSVYTNPDLYIELNYQDKTHFTEIELKSTKNNKIPGSSVQQINPYIWVIFIRKSGSGTEVATGLYINSITETMQFPDRSPRPQVAFNTLKVWNNQNLKYTGEDYILQYDESEMEAKNELITNWKQALVNRWLNTVCDKDLHLKNSTPWFTEAIAMFSIQLIQEYESLPIGEKLIFRQNLLKYLKELE